MTISRFHIGIGVLLFGVVAAASVVFVSSAFALTKEDIVFPVAELGNCGSEVECRQYCDNPENIDSCLDFAEKYNLLSKGEIEKGRKFSKLGAGPGGCTSHSECEAYCNDVNNIEECLAFAEQNGLMPPEELQEARKVRDALRGGAKLPGGCRSKDECEAYCEDDSHFEECIAFAEAAGFISPEELEIVKKTGGKGPGGCRGRACEDFCEREENFQVCLDFAAEHGLISPEELEMARKTGGKGPGGCRGRECERYCEDPANQEVCFNFAKEHGLLRDDDLQRMREGASHLREALSQAPDKVKECIYSVAGSDILQKIESGEFFGGPSLGEQIKQCFEEHFSALGGPPGAGLHDRPFVGPGGCSSEEECKVYCTEHPEECQGFGPPRDDGGRFGPPPGGEFEGEFHSDDFQGEYNRQYEEQFKQEFQRQYELEKEKYYQEGFVPPEGAPCTTIEECLRLKQQYEGSGQLPPDYHDGTYTSPPPPITEPVPLSEPQIVEPAPEFHTEPAPQEPTPATITTEPTTTSEPAPSSDNLSGFFLRVVSTLLGL